MQMINFLLLLPLFCFSLLNAQFEPASRTELSELNPSVVNFNDFFACKRLFSREGTGQTPIGCGSDNDDNGDFGRLIEINNDDDFESFEGLLDLDRTVLISLDVLADQALFTKIANNGRIKAVLVATEDDEEVSLLPDVSSAFLSGGTGLIDTLFTQPMAILSVAETLQVRERLKENDERGLNNLLWNHGGIMSFYNGQEDVTSEFCLSLGECDVLGGQSVWGTVGRDPSSEADIIMLAVKLDTNGLFHDLTFGARDTAGPLAVLLTVAETLAPVIEAVGALDKQIILAAFQGESFDAVGSKRFAFDVENSCELGTENFDNASNTCVDESFLVFTEFNVLDLSKLSTIIVLDNILTFDAVNTIFIQTSDPVGVVTTSLAGLLSDSDGISFAQVVDRSGAELPGTIIQNFQNFAGFDGEGIVLTSYENDISEGNPFIFTQFDKVSDETDISVSLIEDLASVLAAALVTEAAAVEQEAIDIIAGFNNNTTDIAQELTSCLTIDFACDLVSETLGVSIETIQDVFQQQFGTNRAQSLPSPPIFYVGIHDRNAVRQNRAVKGHEEFTKAFLAQKLSVAASEILANNTDETLSCGITGNCFSKVTGEPGNFTLNGACDPFRISSVACVQNKCICSSVFFHDAVSPLVDDTGNIKEVIPTELALERVFTEPRFELPTVTLFQHSRNFTEYFMLGLGVVFTLFSYFLITWSMKKMAATKYKLL